MFLFAVPAIPHGSCLEQTPLAMDVGGGAHEDLPLGRSQAHGGTCSPVPQGATEEQEAVPKEEQVNIRYKV